MLCGVNITSVSILASDTPARVAPATGRAALVAAAPGRYGAGMDSTPDASRERTTEQGRTDATDTPPPLLSRTGIRRLSWTLAWGIPLIALVVGIALTVAGSTEQWEPMGDDTYEVTMLALWPAGLVLLAVGALGVTAVAIATALITTQRPSLPAD